MRTTKHFLMLSFCLLLNVPATPAQDNQRTDQAAAPQAAVIMQGRGVRFFAPRSVHELKLQLADQHGTLLYDSGPQADTDFQYDLKDSNGQPLAPGLYVYTLWLKTPEAETPQQQQGHLIIEQGGERFWLTAKGAGSIGAEVAGGELTMARTPERTTAGAGYTASGRTLSERAGLQRDAQGRTVTEKKADVTREGEQAPLNISGSGTTNRLTKWLNGPGEVVGDSVIHETAAGDLGIGTTTPGGVLDVLRNSPNPLIGRFWNTGTGPAQLRFVGGTGATSQFLITDTAEWLTSIAVSNSIGMQFRVRNTGTPNNEAQLNNSARLTILRNGAVGIGTTNPSSLFQIVMPGATARELHFGTPNSELGYSLLHSGKRADIRYDGSRLQLLNGSGGIPPDTNGIIIDTDGDVGIGTTPSVITTAKLEVSGTSSNNIAVFGTSNSGTAVRGGSNSGTGVEGLSSSSTGVYGSSSSSTGVYGSSSSVGVYGFSTASVGVEGYSANIGIGVGIGVKGSSSGSGSVGVYGTTDSGGLAGSFFGDVNINGTLSKSAGSFKIDHPLDPENKYLSHSFVESPDMMNIYNGVATLDAQGEAVVELPEWFGALNDKFRYQLTALETPGPNLHIAQKIANNRFRIAGGLPGLEVSWQVTGVRKDAYANKHRIPVEEDKPEKERGSYLHPKVFNQPEEKGVEWKLHPEVMQRTKEEREKAQRRAAGETAEKDKH